MWPLEGTYTCLTYWKILWDSEGLTASYVTSGNELVNVIESNGTYLVRRSEIPCG